MTPQTERDGVLIQAQWHRIGVAIELVNVESGVLRQRVRAGEFEAVRTGFTAEPLGVLGLLHYFGPDSPAGYADPQVIALLDEARRETRPDRIDAIYRELAPIFLRDMPFMLIVPGSESFVAHRRLKGLSTPFRANPTWAMEHLWIEEAPN